MSGSRPWFADAALDEAVGRGAIAADLLTKESRARETTLPHGASGESVERGLALRVFLPDGRSAFGALTLREVTFAEGTPPAADSVETLRSLARRTVAAASLSAERALPGLPGGAGADGRGLGLFDPDLDAPLDSFLQSAEEIRGLASAATGNNLRQLRLQGVVSAVRLWNTSGFEGSYRQTLARLDLTLSGEGDESPSATRTVRASRSLRGLSPDSAAAEAAALLEERREPRVPPSGIHTVLLAPAAAAELVAALAGMLGQAKHRSAGGDAGEESRVHPGERVASHAVTLSDDGRLPGGVASAPFDGEGTVTRRTLIVDRGVVVDLLRDLTSEGGKSGSTGNAVRGSFRDPPLLGPTNMFINPGAASPVELQASIRQGLRVSALGRIPPLRDPDTPFAVPFSGRWIQAGRPEAPLAGGWLAGTLRELLCEVDSAGSDFAFTHRRGSFGAPSLLIKRAPVRSS